MTSKYVTELYGHPGQIQPAHIVITSPWFDTREVLDRGVYTNYEGYIKKADRPFDTIRELRAKGWGYNTIAKELGLAFNSVRRWCLKMESGNISMPPLHHLTDNG